MTLQGSFDAEMRDIYVRAKTEARYTARIFLDMVVTRGGVQTAKALINASKPSPGYTSLFERGRLDLTVEARVVENPRFYPLFTAPELERAHRRLREFGYAPKMDTHPKPS